MQTTRELLGKIYTVEYAQAYELEPRDKVFSYHGDVVKTILRVEDSDGDMGECSNSDCCSQVNYYDIYYTDDSHDLVVSSSYPFDRVISEVDSAS